MGEGSAAEAGYKLLTRWRDERYENLASTRLRSISFLLGAFLAASATANAPVGSKAHPPADDLHAATSAGLILVAAGLVLVTFSVMMLARRLQGQAIDPGRVTPKDFDNADDLYWAVLHHFDTHRYALTVWRRCLWQIPSMVGVSASIAGCLLVWASALWL